jgi:hypothetical protein
VKKRNQQKRAPKKVRAKSSPVPSQQQGNKSALETETQEQLGLGKQIMAEYGEVLEKLAKG